MYSHFVSLRGPSLVATPKHAGWNAGARSIRFPCGIRTHQSITACYVFHAFVPAKCSCCQVGRDTQPVHNRTSVIQGGRVSYYSKCEGEGHLEPHCSRSYALRALAGVGRTEERAAVRERCRAPDPLAFQMLDHKCPRATQMNCPRAGGYAATKIGKTRDAGRGCTSRKIRFAGMRR